MMNVYYIKNASNEWYFFSESTQSKPIQLNPRAAYKQKKNDKIHCKLDRRKPPVEIKSCMQWVQFEDLIQMIKQICEV